LRDRCIWANSAARRRVRSLLLREYGPPKRARGHLLTAPMR
jgi:hypothetical protein